MVIPAFGFPTTIQSQFSMGHTGFTCASLMRTIPPAQDGAFVALPDL